MGVIRSGKEEKLPYSLSRWTDLPAAKWPWFEEQLDRGWFLGMDPQTALPSQWSIKPEDTFGLVFWTRDPTNLVLNKDRLKAYPLVVHMSLTCWEEIERGAPDTGRGLFLMEETVKAFGPERVIWRFSPIPTVPDVVDRFERVARVAASLGLKEVFVSFLQENDFVNEPRPDRVKGEILRQMASRSHGLMIRLCNEERLILQTGIKTLARGVCESGQRFVSSNYQINYPKTEGCGCSLAVDPFTINESCIFGCRYCYAADNSLAPRKHNTTKRRLTVIA